jgi:hypothetical protein
MALSDLEKIDVTDLHPGPVKGAPCCVHRLHQLQMRFDRRT